jgi:hypothetical protein
MGKTYRNPKSDSPKQKNKGNQSKNKSTKKNNNKKGKFGGEDFEN